MRSEVYVKPAIFALLLAVSTCICAVAQDAGVPDAADIGQRRRPLDEAPAPNPTQQKALNKERFEKLKKDTDELLKLATELKESVDKANQNTLSLDVIRKTEQIEKLAKSVRDKMKNF
jgi:hypothetical protein